MIKIAPIDSKKPKLICRKMNDKTIAENGSNEAKTLIFVGERYLVLSKYAQKAITVPKIIIENKEKAALISQIP